MGTANGLIAQARKLIGTGESPPGSNHNFITVWYNSAVARIGDGAWCDMSVTYEAWHSDNKTAIGGGFAYVPAHAEWFRSHGQWTYGMHGIRAGDIVFYEWNGRRTTMADHVGVVERVLSDGTIYSLEGNIGDAFRRERRDSTYIAGYGRPHFTGAGAAPAGDTYDMPDRNSVGGLTPLSAPAGQWTTLLFDRQWEPADPHGERGNWGVILVGAAAYDATADVRLTAPASGHLRLVEADPKQGYKIVKEKPPVRFTADDWPSLIQAGRGADHGNHVYVQIRPDTDVTVIDRHAEVIFWRR